MVEEGQDVVYFNSRPCERGFLNQECNCFFFVISIHAPARGASLSSSYYKAIKSISIHAPARGASATYSCLLRINNNFNSRPCERGFVVIPVHITVYSISIHAPARGASGSSPRRSSYKTISIHAPARGASSTRMVFVRLCTDFNSRPCERGF